MRQALQPAERGSLLSFNFLIRKMEIVASMWDVCD